VGRVREGSGLSLGTYVCVCVCVCVVNDALCYFSVDGGHTKAKKNVAERRTCAKCVFITYRTFLFLIARMPHGIRYIRRVQRME